MEESAQYYNSPFYETESFHDPIWESIKVSVFEMRLINAPEFQRLREIKQLGFVNLVYDAAEHSRFVHSIGVCHHAKLLVDQANENFKKKPRYRVWRNYGINNFSEPPTYESVKISIIERIIVSAAALLHDIPHSPFSHEIESPNGNPQTGIPNHDDFDKNPVLFKYLFDTEHSRVAEIIKLYNYQFWNLLKEDKTWFKRIRDTCQNYKATFSPEGFVQIGPNSIIKSSSESKYTELPILGVMIFELHLFEKPEHWVKVGKKIEPADAREVQTEWENSKHTILKWKPIDGWFRPYRKDIVGNTICADLIDYIERDGKQTGIVSSIDLKFLDRMTICRAIPDRGKATELKVTWKVIPDYCEHIVFDIYDHKRGFIRESVITEILACLKARYQLTERVYNHRIVEGARAMLQEISRLLCSKGILNIKLLHTYSPDQANCPTGDNTFLSWVMDTKQRLLDHPEEEKRENIIAAALLARALKERRVYREAVIIDGIHGYITGSLAGGESNCKSLEDAMLDDEENVYARRTEMLSNISARLRDTHDKYFNNHFDSTEQLAAIGARKFGKKYKVPRVLVAKPFSSNSAGVTNIDIQPLFACEDPPHIKIQLDAMKSAYNSLWRVYLFIHPAFHWNFIDEEKEIYVNLHKQVQEDFLEFANNQTPIRWKNSIDFKELLPSVPIDSAEFINNYKPASTKTQNGDRHELLKPDIDSTLKLLNEDLIASVLSKASDAEQLLKKFSTAEQEHLNVLISNDREVLDFISTDSKRTLLTKKLSEIYITRAKNRTPKGISLSAVLFSVIKKIVTDNRGFFENI